MTRLIELIHALDDKKKTRNDKLAALKRCRLDGILNSDEVAELITAYRLDR